MQPVADLDGDRAHVVGGQGIDGLVRVGAVGQPDLEDVDALLAEPDRGVQPEGDGEPAAGRQVLPLFLDWLQRGRSWSKPESDWSWTIPNEQPELK